MPKKLKRYCGKGDLHYITFGCYHRLKLLRSVRARNLFVRTLDEVRRKYAFRLVGFVVMPDHVHLLIGEGEKANPSTVIHGLKLRVSKRMRRRKKRAPGQMSFAFPEVWAPQFWQRRFYDFNVYSARKIREKLEYMHRNPVTQKLVQDPIDWIWSSYSAYSGRGTPMIAIDFVK
jgi:putative transposase